jgi:hypothetical protein
MDYTHTCPGCGYVETATEMHCYPYPGHYVCPMLHQCDIEQRQVEQDKRRYKARSTGQGTRAKARQPGQGPLRVRPLPTAIRRLRQRTAWRRWGGAQVNERQANPATVLVWRSGTGRQSAKATNRTQVWRLR